MPALRPIYLYGAMRFPSRLPEVIAVAREHAAGQGLEVDYRNAAVEEIGTVKFYAADKGFGFIVRDRGGKDIFVHASALNRAGIAELGEGQRVAVDMVEGGKGPEALNIRLI